MNLTSVMFAPGMPDDLGVPRGIIIDRASYHTDHDPVTGAETWRSTVELFSTRNYPRMVKLIGKAAPGTMVTINFEQDQPTAYSPNFDDATNLKAIKNVAAMFVMARRANPGVWLDWNQPGPIGMTYDAWRGMETVPPEYYRRCEYINQAIVHYVIPHVDSVSGQCYLPDPGTTVDGVEIDRDAEVRQYIRLYLWGLSGWGKPINLMTSPWYVGTRNDAINGDDLDKLLYSFARVNPPRLILWGGPPAGTQWADWAKTAEWRQGWLSAAAGGK
jgi:hypothetical protein